MWVWWCWRAAGSPRSYLVWYVWCVVPGMSLSWRSRWKRPPPHKTEDSRPIYIYKITLRRRVRSDKKAIKKALIRAGKNTSKSNCARKKVPGILFRCRRGWRKSKFVRPVWVWVYFAYLRIEESCTVSSPPCFKTMCVRMNTLLIVSLAQPSWHNHHFYFRCI